MYVWHTVPNQVRMMKYNISQNPYNHYYSLRPKPGLLTHISKDGPKMVQLGTKEKNINIFCIGAGHTTGFFPIKTVLGSDFSLQ